MRKGIVLCFGVLLVLASTTAQFELPFSETIEIKHSEDQYALNLTLPAYVRKGTTYEVEDRMVSINISPKDWWRRESEQDFQENREFFIKVLVSIVLSDTDGKVSKDFESYLNCELVDCDEAARKEGLFWDHAGEKRADKAGEQFDKETPLIIADEYITVTLKMLSFYTGRSSVPLITEIDPCESDAECLLSLKGLTLEITVEYSKAQAECSSLFEEAFAYEASGDGFYEAGEFGKAINEYKKAQAIYDELGDTVKFSSMQEQIDPINPEKAKGHRAAGDAFLEAGEFDKAINEYEKAEEIYVTTGDEENSASIKELIEMCRLYQEAEETLQGSIQTFEEAEAAEDKWRTLAIYRKARSHFAEAKVMFDQLEDSEKLEECNDWINRCDIRIERITAAGIDESSISLVWYAAPVIVVGAGIIVVLLILRHKPAEPKARTEPEKIPLEEKSELDMLRYKLATGKITLEEYEKLQRDLEK